jgi:FKBP-type peptidyl-prolyl cis-trans isomerase
MRAFKRFLSVVFVFSVLSGVLNACRNHNASDNISMSIHPDSLEVQLEEANKALNDHEEKIINQYIKRHELNLTATPTGLRYIVYRKGKGVNAEKGDIVRVKYKISLINGIEAYTTSDGQPDEIMIEKSDAVSGIHELLQYMNAGSRARAVIPSYLAYGLSGDQDRIPKGATLIIDIELLQIISFKKQ